MLLHAGTQPPTAHLKFKSKPTALLPENLYGTLQVEARELAAQKEYSQDPQQSTDPSEATRSAQQEAQFDKERVGKERVDASQAKRFFMGQPGVTDGQQVSVSSLLPLSQHKLCAVAKQQQMVVFTLWPVHCCLDQPWNSLLALCCPEGLCLGNAVPAETQTVSGSCCAC